MKQLFFSLLCFLSLSASGQYLAPLDATNSGAKSVGVLVMYGQVNMGLKDTTTAKSLFWASSGPKQGRLARDHGRLYFYDSLRVAFVLWDSVSIDQTQIIHWPDTLTSIATIPYVAAGMATAVKYSDTPGIYGSVIRNGTSKQMATFNINGTGKSGKIVATDTTDNGTPAAAITVDRTLSNEIGSSGHGFKDNTKFNRNNWAYAAFDNRTEMGGTHQDHMTQFQALGAYTGTDTLFLNEGFAGAPDSRNNPGTILEANGFSWSDKLGTGRVYKNTAFRVYPLTGSTKNYSIYSEGPQQSWHQGSLKVGGTAGISDTNTIYNIRTENNIRTKAMIADSIGTDANTDFVLIRNKVVAGYITGTSNNTVYGTNSLPRATTGTNITVIGEEALNNNTTGISITAVGSNAMQANKRGSNSTVMGVGANAIDTNSNANSAFGRKALQQGQNVSFSSAFGAFAGSRNYGSKNTLMGYYAGNGENADMLKDNNIHIGYMTTTTATNDSNTLNIGNNFFGVNVNTGSNSTFMVNSRTAIAGSVFSISGGTFALAGNTTDYTGANGVSYYNTSTGQFKDYRLGVWYNRMMKEDTVSLSDRINTKLAATSIPSIQNQIAFVNPGGTALIGNAALTWNPLSSGTLTTTGTVSASSGYVVGAAGTIQNAGGVLSNNLASTSNTWDVRNSNGPLFGVTNTQTTLLKVTYLPRYGATVTLGSANGYLWFDSTTNRLKTNTSTVAATPILQGNDAILNQTSSQANSNFSISGIGAVVSGLVVGALTPDASEILDVVSTSQSSRPAPVMTKTQRDAIATPKPGSWVTVSNGNYPSFYNGTNWTADIEPVSAATVTLTYGDHFVFTGVGCIATLPAVSTSLIGEANKIAGMNRGTANVVINSNAGSTLYNTSATGTITIAPGSSFTLVPDGTYFNVEK